MALGYSAGGWRVYDSYTPSIQCFSDEIKAARKEKLNPSARIPTKWGWDFDIAKGTVLLEPSASDFSLYKKAFGSISNIHEASSDDTPSPFQATVVLKLPFRYIDVPSEAPSWCFSRVLAFATKASFPHSFQMVSVGDAVTGVIVPTDSDYRTSHLAAWRPCSFVEWQAASPLSFFKDGIQLPTDAIFSPARPRLSEFPPSQWLHVAACFYAGQAPSLY